LAVKGTSAFPAGGGVLRDYPIILINKFMSKLKNFLLAIQQLESFLPAPQQPENFLPAAQKLENFLPAPQ
jgi:hypothetical protein